MVNGVDHRRLSIEYLLTRRAMNVSSDYTTRTTDATLKNGRGIFPIGLTNTPPHYFNFLVQWVTVEGDYYFAETEKSKFLKIKTG